MNFFNHPHNHFHMFNYKKIRLDNQRLKSEKTNIFVIRGLRIRKIDKYIGDYY